MTPEPSELAELHQEDTLEVGDVSADLEVRECAEGEASEAPEVDDAVKIWGRIYRCMEIIRNSVLKNLESKTEENMTYFRYDENSVIEKMNKSLARIKEEAKNIERDGKQRVGELKEAILDFVDKITTLSMKCGYGEASGKLYDATIQILKEICALFDVDREKLFPGVIKTREGDGPNVLDWSLIMFISGRVKRAIQEKK